jgi:LysM repeat protein
MRVRTWSACVVLAWGILLIITAAGPIGSLRPAQANTRIASSTGTTSTTRPTTTITTQATLTSTSAGAPTAAGAETATRADTVAGAGTVPRAVPGTASYVVQPGDTLSGIATALGIPGGWPALYAANRRAVGPDPGLIRPGAVLVLPGRAAPARYTVAAGDTLSGIASALGIPGGWPALYAANTRVIGPDPDTIRAGTALAIPRRASSPSSSPPPASRPSPSASPASHPASTPTRTPASAQPSARATTPAREPASASARASGPASAQAPTQTSSQRHPRSIPALPTGGLPRWLLVVLVAAGVLITTASLTEPVLAIARRRRAARPSADAHIILADYERLVVTHSRQDGTVYVLRPPDADPHAILLAARLVLAQDRYEALAGHLGVPAHWPRE